MIFGKKHAPAKSYDKESQTPVVKSSICTGEKVAGFRDKATGKIEEVMLISSPADLAEFKRMYAITGEVETVY